MEMNQGVAEVELPLSKIPETPKGMSPFYNRRQYLH
jgi:hypothetical protein